MRIVTLGVLLGLSGFGGNAALAEPQDYDIEYSHSRVLFTVSHLGYTPEYPGMFHLFEGSFRFDPDDYANNSVEVTIDVASLDMHHKYLNALLVTDWFKFSENPTIHFVSTGAVPTGEDSFDVAGDLTFFGTTRPVTLAVKVNKFEPHPRTGVPRVGFTAETVIKRGEFGMEQGIPAIGGDIPVKILVEGMPKGQWRDAEPDYYQER